MALSNVERTKQVARWLREEYPARKPVRLRFLQKVSADRDDTPTARRLGHFADVVLYADGWQIRLCTRLECGMMIDSLIHEWAHILAGEASGYDGHRRPWSDKHGRIYAHYHDEGGQEASKAY